VADYVFDTFTGGGAVNVDSHAGEVGATWTTDPAFGAGYPEPAFYVTGGVLRRVKNSEVPGSANGEMRCSPSGSAGLPADDYFIEVGYSLAALSNTQMILFGSNWGGAGSSYEALAYVDGYSGGDISIRTNPSILGSPWYTTPANNVAGTSRVLRLEFAAGQITVKVDGVSKHTAATGAFVGPVWIDLFDSAGNGHFQIEHFQIGDLVSEAPPVAFWAEFQKCSEIV